jgi:hypothetical protein
VHALQPVGHFARTNAEVTFEPDPETNTRTNAMETKKLKSMILLNKGRASVSPQGLTITMNLSSIVPGGRFTCIANKAMPQIPKTF